MSNAYTKEYFPTLQVNTALRVTDRALASLPAGKWDVCADRDWITNALVVRMRGWLLSQKNTVEIAYPLDWWEAVKARFAPRWFTKRYPVRYERWSVEGTKFWQHAPVPYEWGKATAIYTVSPREDARRGE